MPVTCWAAESEPPHRPRHRNRYLYTAPAEVLTQILQRIYLNRGCTKARGER